MSVHHLMALLRSPASTGAVLPSSRYLANAMADAAKGADAILELGPGTGAITAALVARWPASSITAVEIQPELAARLRARFPHVAVVQAPASQVIDDWQQGEGQLVLVSSLPFRSLPQKVREETVASLGRFLLHNPQRRLVQYTYQPRAPFAPPAGLVWRRLRTIWRNTPPAGVWELRAAG